MQWPPTTSSGSTKFDLPIEKTGGMAQSNESDEFIFSFPLRVLVHESIVDDPSNFSKLLMAERADGRLIAHLFTDEDLAERFALSHPGSLPRALRSAEGVTSLLDSLAKIGCDHFSFDALNENTVLALPIGTLRETLKQYPNSRSD
jgi:hypothetical protein